MNWQLKSSYTKLPPVFYAYMNENPVQNPSWLIKNESLAKEFDVSLDEALQMLAGNAFSNEVEAIAQSYAGHQFGHFTMLGDGRAILLGELEVNGRLVDVQLKGAGPTPYSRGGDGRAAVGPMLREYLMSEAMHALGVPTTRSLAVVATGEAVQRERPLAGAILTRVASSHLRVGTFEFAARYTDDVKLLADYAIERHDPELAQEKEKYRLFLARVVSRQASLIAKWQQIGFVHGVMNTDNTTISGETIDYGPCAFIDTYSLNAVFSSIDTNGRYAFGNQPNIAIWNVARLAESLLPLLHEDAEEARKIAKAELDRYPIQFYEQFFSGMLRKLGIAEQQDGDEELVKDLLALMEEAKADYTNTFRALSDGRVLPWMEQNDTFSHWHARWTTRLTASDVSLDEAFTMMQSVNPVVIPRNFYVDEAIRYAEMGDMSKFHTLLHALQSPFAVNESTMQFTTPPDDCGPFVTYCGT